jgi:hypothetical protein
LVDIEEKEEIDGVKYYKLFFYPGWFLLWFV